MFSPLFSLYACVLFWLFFDGGQADTLGVATERKSIDHLVAKVYTGHEKSIKVLRKCGGREGEIL